MESATTQSEPKKAPLGGFYSMQEARNRKSKVVSVYTMKAYMGSTYSIINRYIRWRLVVNFKPWQIYTEVARQSNNELILDKY